MQKKFFYLVFSNLEFLVMFIIDVFRERKDRAIFLLVGEFVVMLGVIQPLVYLIVGKPQSTHRFLSLKYFFISAVLLALLVMYETGFNSTSIAFGLIYPVFIYVYVFLENLNPVIMKIVYSLLLIHKEDDLFNYPKDFDLTGNDTSAEIFFEYASNPKIIQAANYFRSRQSNQSVKTKKELIWRIMKSIIQLKKDEETTAFREDRRNKIESYFMSLKKEKEEDVEKDKMIDWERDTGKMSRRQRNNQTFDLSESELRPSRYNLTNQNFPSEPRLTQPNLTGESVTTFERVNQDSTVRNNETLGQILWQRLKSLHWPKKHFYKITYLVFFPYYFLFALTIPKLKHFVSIKQTFFGFIFCLLFFIGLTVVFYFIVSAMTTHWAIGNGLSGLMSAGVSVNYLIYCISFTSHSEKYFNISVQEMIIVKTAIAMCLSIFYDLLLKQVQVVTSRSNLLIAGSILVSNGLVMFLLSLIMAEKIPAWLHVVFFGLVSGYATFVVLVQV